MRSYRRTAAAVLAVSMTVLLAADVHADDTMTYEEALQAAYDIVPDTNNIRGWPQGPHVYGNSAVVVDMDSGAVLYGKKADERHYPASITKLMTALVALENSEPDDEVLFSQDSVSFLEYGDASIGMTPGEILSMNDAMYGMLLASANEVSYAIAESVGKLMGGDYNTFLQAMNDRAEELGCTDSHWMNANGLHNDQHYTTAHDMARIASAVYQFEGFRTVTQTLNYTIGPTNLVGESRTFQQNHKMLWPGNPNYYEYCTGGKTGYTDQSRTTLVTMADNGNMRLVAVLLQDDGDVYADTRAMFDYVYSNFSKVQLKGQQKAEGISSYEDDAAYVVLPAGIDFSSLDSEITITDKKEGTGKVTYFYEGQDVGSADVVLTPEYVKEQTGYDITPRITKKGSAQADTPKEEAGLSLPVKILIGAGAAVVVLFLIFCAVVRYILVKKRRRRMAMARRRRSRKAEYAGSYARRHPGSGRHSGARRSSGYRSGARRSRYASEAGASPSGRRPRR